MDERLKQYLQECRKKKQAWEQVNHVMEGSNYPAETIAEAKVWYEHPDGVVESTAEVKSANPIKPKKKWGIFGLLMDLVVLLIFLGGGGYGAVYLVATQKLTLPNQNLQEQLLQIGMALPGVPKNPKLILEMVEEAHKKVSKSSFEISMSGQIDAAEIDLQATGFSDVSDNKNPRFSINLLSDQELDIDIRKPDKMMYIKVNKLPVALYALLGVDPVKIKPLWENWIGVDVSESQMEKDEFMDLNVSEEAKNGIKVYKLSFNKKSVSETVKSVNVDMWVDKKNMLILEMKILGIIEIENKLADITAIVTMTDYGKDIPIVKPDKYLSPEEFLSEFMKVK